jgi:hypothetical protein
LVDAAMRGFLMLGDAMSGERVTVCLHICTVRRQDIRRHAVSHIILTQIFFLIAGPNIENQKSIADTGVYDLCDRVLSRIRFEDVAHSLYNYDEVLQQNEFRSRVKLVHRLYKYWLPVSFCLSLIWM